MARKYRWEGTVVVPFDEPNFTHDVHIVKRRGFPLGEIEAAFWEYAFDYAARREAGNRRAADGQAQ